MMQLEEAMQVMVKIHLLAQFDNCDDLYKSFSIQYMVLETFSISCVYFEFFRIVK